MTFSRAPDSALGLLTLETQSQINALCERFEDDWKGGASPSAETLLASSGIDAPDALLYELLGIEGHYRRHDTAFCQETCARRFPEHAAAIGAWFACAHLLPGTAADSLEDRPEPAGAGSSAADGSTLVLPEGEPATADEGICGGAAGRFRVLRPHASGGLGEIWLARDAELGRDVALKQITSRFADDPDCQARFLREAQTTGRLEHPGIVPVYGLGTDRRGRPYYAMRLLGGETLHAAICRWHECGARPGVDFRKLLRQFLDVCNVVEFAHRRGFIHRDLKPQNVMLGEFGETVVLDWGLARELADCELPAAEAGRPHHNDEPAGRPRHNESDAGRTQPGTVLGTPGYMSPEQAWGRIDELAAASDVFSLGAILYCTLTGQSPYGNRAGLRDDEQARSCKFEPPRSKNRRAPAALEAICLKAMSREPADRYPSARALADDVERWLADEPVAVYPDAWPARVFRWSRRHKTLVTTGAVAGMVLLTALAALVVVQERAQERIIERNRVIERQRDESYTQIEREQTAKAARLFEQGDEARAALRLVPESRRGWEWRRLWFELDLRPNTLSSLPSHDWGVLDLLWDEPSHTLVSTGHDGRLLLRKDTDPEPLDLVRGSWSPNVAAWRHALFGFSGDPPDRKADDCYLRLAWLEPGKQFVAVSLHGKVTRWSLSAGGLPERQELAQHDRPLFCIASQRDVILCGDDQGALLLISPGSGAGREIRKPLATASPVLDVAALPDGRWVAAQADGRITLLDNSAAEALSHFTTDCPAWDLDVSPDGRMLAVGCGRGQVDCYRIDASSNVLARDESYPTPPTLDDRPTALSVVRFSPDGQWLAAGDERGRLLVWDRHSRKLALLAPTHRVMSEDRADELPWPFRRRLAAVAFSPSGDQCFLAGHDPVLRRWRVRGRSGITKLTLGPGPHVRFDPVQTSLLWAGTGDGMLSVWESRTGRRIAQTLAHAGPIVAIDIASPQRAVDGDDGLDVPSESLVATCDLAGEVRLWALRGDKLAALDTVIKHGRPLGDVALSPDGRRIAAYDRVHQVLLWEWTTGRLLATRDVSESGASLPKARLAFNADGTRLAAFGPGSVLWLLGGTDLEVIEKPDVVAGGGGTALAWHPHNPATLYAGDVLGRALAYPRGAWPAAGTGARRAWVAGVGWSTAGDGGRVAVGWRNGETCIVDPKWAGLLLTLKSPHAALGESQLADLTFDARGERLAAVHEDGAVEIWETPAETKERSAARLRHWRRSQLAAGPELAGLILRPQAIALDEHDRLAMFVTTFDRSQDRASPEAEGRRFLFLREGDRAVQTEVMPYRAVTRSLTLARRGEQWLATVRRPLPEEGGVSGAFLFLRGRQRPRDGKLDWSEEDLTPRPNNEGFDVELLHSAGPSPAVVHFSHYDSHLSATWHDGRDWKTVRLGRQGDGYRHLTAATPNGKAFYSVFSPDGLNGKLWNITCLTTDWRPAAGNSDDASLLGSRETCETAFQARPCSLAVEANGFPLLLYTRPPQTERPGLVLARRTDKGWQKSTVFDFVPRVVSNMTMDAGGAISFAYLAPDEKAIHLATGQTDRWATEVVAELPGADSDSITAAELSELFFLRDRRGRPLIIASSSGHQSGAILCFRPEE